MTSIRRTVLTLLTLTMVACGGAGAEPKSPPRDSVRKEEPLPATVEEAQDQIARAHAELTGTKPSADSSKPAERAPPPPQAPQGGASSREERYEDTCNSPCRALVSMRRAVEALCRMTGDSDTRCVEAKRTLTESATRVSSCKCEAH